MDDTYHVGNLDHHLDHLLLNAGDHGGPDAERAILGDFGHSLSQQDAEYLQAANGWVNLDDASGIQGVGQLLRAHGVDYHRVEHGTVGQVMSELHAGHRVIVGLQDHNFGSNSALQLFFQEVADRLGFKIEPEAGERQAIAIKGVDFHDPHHPKILLYNPKSADGEVIPYSLEDFTKAWEGSDFSFLATDSNPQPALPGAEQGPIEHLVSKAVGLGTAGAVFSWTGHPGLALASGKLAEEGTEFFESWIKSL